MFLKRLDIQGFKSFPQRIRVDFGPGITVNYPATITSGTQATVSITSYQFKFIVPLIGTTINMPAYRTTLPGESAGFVPCDIPNATPYAPCSIVPN